MPDQPRDHGLKNVAEDRAIVAELLLLLRLILTDGEVRDAELAMLQRICRESLDVEEAALPGLMYVVQRWAGRSEFQRPWGVSQL